MEEPLMSPGHETERADTKSAAPRYIPALSNRLQLIMPVEINLLDAYESDNATDVEHALQSEYRNKRCRWLGFNSRRNKAWLRRYCANSTEPQRQHQCEDTRWFYGCEIAAVDNHLTFIRLLLEYGADLSIRRDDSYGLLTIATVSGNTDAVKLLVYK